MNAVRSASSVNIAINPLEDLEESDYKKKYEESHIYPGHILHLADNIISLVYAEDLIMTRTILRPGNDRNNENRTKIFKYNNFGIIFDGTPSFAEAEVCDILCTKNTVYFQSLSHSVLFY